MKINTSLRSIALAAIVVTLALTACGTATPTPAAVAGAGAAAAPAALPATVDTAEAARLREAGAFVLDVREPSEWNEAHIPGATLIPLGELSARVSELPRDKQIVVVCRSGNRSQSGREVLREAGFSSVTSMSGGLIRWQSAGLPLESGQ
jgi:rhodanese-related sulfurtransferase